MKIKATGFMAKHKSGKSDKELATLRAQVEALKAELADKRRSEVWQSPVQKSPATSVSYSVTPQTIPGKKDGRGPRSASAHNYGIMTLDTNLIKKDLIKSLILSGIFITLISALKLLSPYIPFLPF